MSENQVETQWECDKCTFVNAVSDLTCIMCYTVRVDTKNMAYTWQWQAADQWIPYDAVTCLQLETAWHAHKERQELSQGYFADKQGEYAVYFKARTQPNNAQSHNQDDNSQAPSPPLSSSSSAFNSGFYQLNLFSHGRRPVRRVALDDEVLLLPVAHDAAEGTCTVCQEELGSDGDTPCAHLPRCTHVFHRRCIYEWITLHDHCPTCKTRL